MKKASAGIWSQILVAQLKPIPIGDFLVHQFRLPADWKSIGVDRAIEVIPCPEAERRWAANDFDVTVFTGAGGYDVILGLWHHVPLEGIWSQQGILWSNWYQNPNSPRSKKPPAPVKENIALHRKLVKTAAHEQQNKLMGRIIDIAAGQFQVIGIHLPLLSHGVAKLDFHNAPPLMFSSAYYPQPAPTNPCRFFIPQP